MPDTLLTFQDHGAQRFPGAAGSLLDAFIAQAAQLPSDQAGVRLRNQPALRPLLAPSSPIGAIAAQGIRRPCQPVRAILFDKSATTNWSLGWHQDRVICVRERRTVEGFGPWTVKQGVHHVAPPIALLDRMVTVRIHLDDVPANNAPLLVAPKSHKLGRIAEADIASVVAHLGQQACLAQAGDVWLYATPILHASSASTSTGHRRVLQVDYSADDLPGGLEWLGL